MGVHAVKPRARPDESLVYRPLHPSLRSHKQPKPPKLPPLLAEQASKARSSEYSEVVEPEAADPGERYGSRLAAKLREREGAKAEAAARGSRPVPRTRSRHPHGLIGACGGAQTDTQALGVHRGGREPQMHDIDAWVFNVREPTTAKLPLRSRASRSSPRAAR